MSLGAGVGFPVLPMKSGIAAHLPVSESASAVTDLIEPGSNCDLGVYQGELSE